MAADGRTPMYRIELACGPGLMEWQGFVDSQPQSHALHHAAWFHVLVESSAVKPLFLMARADGGAIVGVMPAYLSRSAVFGTHVTTLDAGILAADPSAAAELVDHMRGLLPGERAKYFLLRGEARDGDDENRNAHVVTIVDTKQSSEQMSRRIGKKTRWYIRHARKQGLSVRVDRELADIDVFYSLYAAHVHRLGTPVMGKAMMQAMAQRLGPRRLRLLLAERGGEVVGGMLIVVANRGFFDLYALIRHDLRDTAAGYLLYWQALELASHEGAAELNLGRSIVGSGTHQFKMKWGGRDEPLIYRYFPASDRDQVRTLEKLRRGEALRQRLWRNLPLWAANRFGPILRRQLPFG